MGIMSERSDRPENRSDVVTNISQPLVELESPVVRIIRRHGEYGTPEYREHELELLSDAVSWETVDKIIDRFTQAMS